LGEICHRLTPFPVPIRFQNFPPFMTMAYDVFGASRMMWGSDFPPVAGREGYRNALQWTMEHIPFRSEGDKEWLLVLQRDFETLTERCDASLPM
jgi:hypothetical protein